MTFDEYVNKWLGKRDDYDGVNGYQCVDPIKRRLDEVDGIKAGSWGNAIDYWTSTRPEILAKFDRIAYTGQLLQKADILILKPLTTPYGHIAQATSPTQMLEQNGGTGDGSGLGTDAIRIRTIPFSRGILGILRPKEVQVTDRLTKEELVVLYSQQFDVSEAKVNQDVVKAFTGKPLAEYLNFIKQDASYKAHFVKVNTPSVYTPVTEQLFKKG